MIEYNMIIRWLKNFFSFFSIGAIIAVTLAILFSVFFFLLKALFIILIILFTGGVALYFIFSAGKKKKPKQAKQTAKVVKKPRSVQLGEAEDKLKKMHYQAGKISKPEIRKRFQELYRIGCRIIDKLDKEPAKIPSARQFLNYYLDASLNIVQRYVELQSHQDYLEDAPNAMRESEEILDLLEKAYQKQLDKLFTNDFMDLDAELRVLKQEIEAKEGPL